MQQRVDGGGPLSTKMVDAVLACSDGLRQYVEGLKQGNGRLGRVRTLRPNCSWPGSRRRARRRDNAGQPSGRQLHAKVAAVAGEPDATLVGEAYFQPALPWSD